MFLRVNVKKRSEKVFDIHLWPPLLRLEGISRRKRIITQEPSSRFPLLHEYRLSTPYASHGDTRSKKIFQFFQLDPEMDEEPYIIAAWMAAEERLRLEKKAARRREQKLLDSYQPFQYDQRPNRSIGKWFILGAVIKSK
jgi:hypothetical protein